MSLFNELKRRNVFRVGVAYLLAAWVLLQIVDFVLDMIAAPNWIMQVFFLAAAVGLPVVLVFSWVFEMTPEGVKRESEIDRSQSITPNTGRKLDRVIIGFLAVSVVLLLADRFISSKSGSQEHEIQVAAETVAVSEGESGTPDPLNEVSPSEKSIAVLPFLTMSSGPDDGYFADGLTEEILNALAQLPELLVTSRTSSFHFKGQDISMEEIAAKLGVATVVEGSVRRSGDRLRVTAQLIRTEDGIHLWSENYDSTSADTIAVQEDIAEKIARAMNVVLDEDKHKAMRRAGLRDVEAFIAMQKGRELFEKAHGDNDLIPMLRQANVYFNLVLKRVPSYALAYSFRTDLYTHQLQLGASGGPNGVTEPEEVAEALKQTTANHEAAVRYASTVGERNNAELDLAYVTTQWQGTPARIERYAGDKDCGGSSWVDNISFAYGYAGRLVDRTRQLIVCNPLASSSWRSLVRAELWSGDPEAALQAARQGSELAPGEWLSSLLVTALVAMGDYEQAESEAAARLQVDVDILSARIMIAAAQGDSETVADLLEQHYQNAEHSNFWGLSYHAWAGDRENANRIAAQIDQHAFGSQALTASLLWCVCGAAFDLSETPNFAAKIEQSGLTWPPLSPINFPLKDW